MINSPNPSNGCTVHKIIDVLVDPELGSVSVAVGSWSFPDKDEGPKVRTSLQIKYASWVPEYYDQLEDAVNQHPEWTGSTPYKPNSFSAFNLSTQQWEELRSLQKIKDAQWVLIKQSRSQAEYIGFTWNASIFDSDPISQNRITGAVTLAQITSNFSIDWILKDNTIRTLNQAEMLEVGLTLGQHVAAQFTKAQALRVLIEAATSPEEVESLVW